MKIVCHFCSKETNIPNGAYNRAVKKGAPLYCNISCAGLGRRKYKPKAQKIEEKRLYDVEYRSKNRELLKAKKHEWFKKAYDPDEAKIYRKGRAEFHKAYCQRPEYREWKKDYDRQYRARDFGPYADAYLTLLNLQNEIASRMSKYEIYSANGTLNKSLQRKRHYANFISG